MLKLEEVSVECKMNNENDVNPNLVIDYCISYKKPEEVVGTNMCDKCGKPTTMTFKYTGVDTKANSQGSDGISSGLKAEDEGSLSTVRIVTKGKGNKGKIYADVIVNLGETFVLEVAPGDSKFQNKLETEIYDENNKKIQEIKFNSKCSKPIVVGDEFGLIKLMSAWENSSCGASIISEDAGGECTAANRAPGSISECACATLETVS